MTLEQQENLLHEAELYFGLIDGLIHSDSSEDELRLAKTYAWRMQSRIEEIRNRHITI